MGKILTQEELRKKRIQESADLLSRVEKGEVSRGNYLATAFPPRPVIQKNVEEVKSIFGVVSQDTNNKQSD